MFETVECLRVDIEVMMVGIGASRRRYIYIIPGRLMAPMQDEEKRQTYAGIKGIHNERAPPRDGICSQQRNVFEV